MKRCPSCHYGKNHDGVTVCKRCGYIFPEKGKEYRTPFEPDITSSHESGDIIAGRYRIEKTLGRGGMGVVYLASDLELRDKQVALKLIHPNILSNRDGRHRFQDEVMISLDLYHKSIVRVFDFYRHGDQRFYTMEYIPGRNLREEIINRRDNKSTFTLKESAAVILPLLEALGYAHDREIIHRDVKPGNIILNGTFPDIRIKVVDFGLAKTLTASQMTSMAQAVGTAYYIAPEQMAGQAVDHRADLYSVGMILYELLSGELAVGMAEPPSVLNPDLPKEIDGVVARFLNRLPEKRYSDAGEAMRAIEKILPGDPSIDSEPTGREKKRPARPRQKRITNSMGMEFLWIEPGMFMMGSPKKEKKRSDDENLHQVTLTKGFYIQRTPVTVGQWRKFVQETGYETEAEKKKEARYWDNPGFVQTNINPVTSVSWNDAQAFIQWLSEKGPGIYELPTEAQWEYAARAGGKTRFFFGEDENRLEDFAWIVSNSEKKTHAVNLKEPNGWGLYDMLGNVWEWCGDCYGKYPSGSATDPVGPLDGSYRVFRGGSWFYGPWNARCAKRIYDKPDFRDNDVGFRLVLKPDLAPNSTRLRSRDLLAQGEVFAGRYKVEKLLDSGGTGDVYLTADCQSKEKKVILKVVNHNLSSDPKLLKQIQDEADTYRKLNHSAFVCRNEIEQLDGQFFFTMEYVDGQDLQDLIDSRKDRNAPFGPDEAIAIVVLLLEALAYAHLHFVHLNIKPGKIMVTGKFPDIAVKILDSGCSLSFPGLRMIGSQAQIMGTPIYMAPEQAAGLEIDARADLYSVGVILHQLLTGILYSWNTDINQELPSEFGTVVQRLLQKHPENRYSNALEACRDLHASIAHSVQRNIRPVSLIRGDQKRVVNPIGMEFVCIEPGTFEMGSGKYSAPVESESFLMGYNPNSKHRVTLSDGYYLQTTPVTVAHWRYFIEDTGYQTAVETKEAANFISGNNWKREAGIYWGNPGFSQSYNCPVTCVSYHDAQAFIDWLHDLERGVTYNLPTEAQWEYTCREAMTANRYPSYNPNTGKKEKKRYTAPVKLSAPNDLGIYDMLGNVWEWCADWYGDYPRGHALDPQGPAKGSLRVHRGGSWKNRNIYRAMRSGGEPDSCDNFIGFRICRKR